MGKVREYRYTDHFIMGKVRDGSFDHAQGRKVREYITGFFQAGGVMSLTKN